MNPCEFVFVKSVKKKLQNKNLSLFKIAIIHATSKKANCKLVQNEICKRHEYFSEGFFGQGSSESLWLPTKDLWALFINYRISVHVIMPIKPKL